jgi:hypothetical protein
MVTVRGEPAFPESCQEENESTQDIIAALNPERSIGKQGIRLRKSDDKSPNWEGLTYSFNVNLGNAT